MNSARIRRFIHLLGFSFVFLFSCFSYAQPLGDMEARILLTRLGFAPTAQEVAEIAPLTQAQAVDLLLNVPSTVAQTPAPIWVNEPIPSLSQRRAMSELERSGERKMQVIYAQDLGAWWMQEMLNTPTPLRERMTLFWHNHFVSGEKKVKSARLMYQQNVLLRQHALGNFAQLLHALSKDPAMLIYLDSISNRKGQPNENFAREVMELFTLGEGHYSEQDVKEAARAFTGWGLDPETYTYVFRRFAHDDQVKTILGHSGNFDGDAVLDILLAQPATADFIVRKLWREFVSPTPDEVEVKRIASVFRDNHYAITPMLRALFNTTQLLAPDQRGTLVKSPVELLVGTLRQFDFQFDQTLPFSLSVMQLGQQLFDPPNVKGWPGGEVWINSTTLLNRKQMLERLLRAVTIPGESMVPTENQPMLKMFANAVQATNRVDKRQRITPAMARVYYSPDAWLKHYGAAADRVVSAEQRQRLEWAVLPLAPAIPVPENLTGINFLHALVLDPVYQLK